MFCYFSCFSWHLVSSPQKRVFESIVADMCACFRGQGLRYLLTSRIFAPDQIKNQDKFVPVLP
jgi:hypothetical protein